MIKKNILRSLVAIVVLFLILVIILICYYFSSGYSFYRNCSSEISKDVTNNDNFPELIYPSNFTRFGYTASTTVLQYVSQSTEDRPGVFSMNVIGCTKGKLKIEPDAISQDQKSIIIKYSDLSEGNIDKYGHPLMTDIIFASLVARHKPVVLNTNNNEIGGFKVIFSPDSKHFLYHSSSKEVYVYKTKTGEMLSKLEDIGSVKWLDDETLGIITNQGWTKVFDIDNKKMYTDDFKIRKPLFKALLEIPKGGEVIQDIETGEDVCIFSTKRKPQEYELIKDKQWHNEEHAFIERFNGFPSLNRSHVYLLNLKTCEEKYIGKNIINFSQITLDPSTYPTFDELLEQAKKTNLVEPIYPEIKEPII